MIFPPHHGQGKEELSDVCEFLGFFAERLNPLDQQGAIPAGLRFWNNRPNYLAHAARILC